MTRHKMPLPGCLSMCATLAGDVAWSPEHGQFHKLKTQVDSMEKTEYNVLCIPFLKSLNQVGL